MGDDAGVDFIHSAHQRGGINLPHRLASLYIIQEGMAPDLSFENDMMILTIHSLEG